MLIFIHVVLVYHRSVEYFPFELSWSVLIQVNEQHQNNFNLLYLLWDFRAGGGRWQWLSRSMSAVEQGQHLFWLSQAYCSCCSAFSQITLNKRKRQFTASSRQPLWSFAPPTQLPPQSLCVTQMIHKKSVSPYASLPQITARNLGNASVQVSACYCFVTHSFIQRLQNKQEIGHMKSSLSVVLIWKKRASGNKRANLKFLSSLRDSQRSEWRRHLFPSDYLRINL